MKIWEYEIEIAYFGAGEINANIQWLNERGQQGWELISCEGGKYIFKRLVEEGV